MKKSLLISLFLIGTTLAFFQNCGNVGVSHDEASLCVDADSYQLVATQVAGTSKVSFTVSQTIAHESFPFNSTQNNPINWLVDTLTFTGTQADYTFSASPACEQIPVSATLKSSCGTSLPRAGKDQLQMTYADNRACTPTPTPTPAPTPAPFVLPAGFQCLDSPLHTIMASEQYAQISSTSTSLLDRREYFATRLKGNSMIWTVKIIVAAGDSTVSKAPAWFEVGQGYGSGPAPRIVTLSKNKCDTSETNNIVISGAARPSNNSTFEFSLNEPTRAGISGLTTGVYYLNIQNVDCGVGQSCDVLLDWHGAY